MTDVPIFYNKLKLLGTVTLHENSDGLKYIEINDEQIQIMIKNINEFVKGE